MRHKMKYLVLLKSGKVSVVRIDKDIGTGLIMAIRSTRKAAKRCAKILRKGLT
jgi:K+/H+ antiporter YhaU regulatory subunit KhtT